MEILSQHSLPNLSDTALFDCIDIRAPQHLPVFGRQETLQSDDPHHFLLIRNSSSVREDYPAFTKFSLLGK